MTSVSSDEVETRERMTTNSQVVAVSTPASGTVGAASGLSADLAHRRAARRRAANLGGLAATVAGQAVELLNVSTNGLAILLPIQASFSIDDQLKVHLHQSGVPVAVVRVQLVHISRTPRGAIVGGSFARVDLLPAPSTRHPRIGDLVEVRDEPLRMAAFAALMDRPVTGTLCLVDDRTIKVELREGPEGAKQLLLVGDLDWRSIAGEFVSIRVNFHRAELILRGQVNESEGRCGLLRQWRLFSLARRRSERVSLQPQEGSIEWRDPLDSDRVGRAAVTNVAADGIGITFAVDSTQILPASPFPVVLKVRDTTVSILAQVARSTRCEGGDTIVGLAIRQLHQLDTHRLAEVLQGVRCKNLAKRRSADRTAVSELMRESGYLGLRDGAVPDSDWHALPGDESLSVDTVYMSDSGAMLGHISCLRIYPQTWIYHQLATVGMHRAAVAYPLYIQLTEWTSALAASNQAFAMGFFDQRKSWHRLLVGDFVRWVGSEALSVIKGLDRMEAVDAKLPVSDEDTDLVTVGKATPTEFPFVASLARAYLPRLLADALHIDPSSIVTTNLCGTHDVFGLERQRITLVARHEGRIVGAAICETGSRRLSLFNIVNVAYVFVLDPLGLSMARAVEGALLRRVRRFYRDRNVTDPLIVAPEGNVKFPNGAGLAIVETMAAWVASLDGLRQWRNFIHFEMGEMSRGRRRRV